MLKGVVMQAPEYLTTEDVMARYRFPSREAVRNWLRRHLVPVSYRGRVLLVRAQDIEAVFVRGRRSVRFEPRN